jgi:hypothetical protein
MGRAPVGPGGSYVSGEGGYFFQDQADVLGHGVETASGATRDVFVSPNDSWHAGLAVGYAAPGALISGLPFSRAEAYFTFSDVEDEATDHAPPFVSTTLKSVDGSASGVIGDFARTSVERQISEGGLRLATDQANGRSSSLTWVVAPFVRFTDENTDTVASGTADTAWRSANVETWAYGVTLAVEPEVWITPDVALVGRAGVGVYGYDADGSFRSHSTAPDPDPFAARLSDDASGVGFRGQLGAGVKFKLAPSATLTAYSEADYLSAVGTADLADNQPTTETSSRLDIEEAWELRSGLRITLGFGPAR